MGARGSCTPSRLHGAPPLSPHRLPFHHCSTSPGCGSGARDGLPGHSWRRGWPHSRPCSWAGGAGAEPGPPPHARGWAGVPGSVWVSRRVQPHAMASAGRVPPPGRAQEQLQQGGFATCQQVTVLGRAQASPRTLGGAFVFLQPWETCMHVRVDTCVHASLCKCKGTCPGIFEPSVPRPPRPLLGCSSVGAPNQAPHAPRSPPAGEDPAQIRCPTPRFAAPSAAACHPPPCREEVPCQGQGPGGPCPQAGRALAGGRPHPGSRQGLLHIFLRKLKWKKSGK